jgi:hypothetical protein
MFCRTHYSMLMGTANRPAWARRWVCLCGAAVGLAPIGSHAHHPILFLGEYHGNNQSPAFFGDAMATVSEFKPVLVIFEQSPCEARLATCKRPNVDDRHRALRRMTLGIQRSATSGRRATQYCTGEVAPSITTATGKWPHDPQRGGQRPQAAGACQIQCTDSREHLPALERIRRVTCVVGALLLEQNDEWQLQRRYMQLEGLQILADSQPARLAAVVN